MEAIALVAGLQKKPRFYRVQVGAFSKRENAQAMLDKLKAAGFKDAYIKLD
jgi:cell division septation protein DedD